MQRMGRWVRIFDILHTVVGTPLGELGNILDSHCLRLDDLSLLADSVSSNDGANLDGVVLMV